VAFNIKPLASIKKRTSGGAFFLQQDQYNFDAFSFVSVFYKQKAFQKSIA
jgi:hypothetical protein